MLWCLENADAFGFRQMYLAINALGLVKYVKIIEYVHEKHYYLLRIQTDTRWIRYQVSSYQKTESR